MRPGAADGGGRIEPGVAPGGAGIPAAGFGMPSRVAWCAGARLLATGVAAGVSTPPVGGGL
jgi:hypothetical protein